MNPIAKLGPYNIYEKLGEGGLAKVFLAKDTTEGNATEFVALKCEPGSRKHAPHPRFIL